MNRGLILGILSLLIIVVSTRMSPVEAANLTIPIAGRVSIELITSNAAFSNTLSVISPTVGKVATGCNLQPAVGLGGVPILSEKLSQHGCRVDLDADTATAGIQGFAAGTVFEFGMCAQTDADPACEFVWSSDPTSNSDGDDHVQTTTLSPGVFQLAWEDLENLGDMDFDDLIAVVRVQADNDGDGLWDDWETSGIDTDADGVIDLDLPALGADPDRKDIFLEIDYLDCTVAGHDCAAGDPHSHMPKAAAITAMVDAFANAPVANPDATTGITLHVDVDDAIAHQNTLALGCGFGNSFDILKQDPANFGPTNPRRFAYHYAIFAHRQGATTSSGCGELPGNDFLVTLGEWNTRCISRGANGTLDTAAVGDDLVVGTTIYAGPDLVCDTAAVGDDVQVVPLGTSPTADLDGDGSDDRTVGTVQQQSGTVMHEFGHNLQLCHGGQFDPPGFNICNTNRKPNYLSIMSYAFQIPGIPPTDPDGAGPLAARVDYSPTDLADLNENNLNEPSGIGDGTDNTRHFCPAGGVNIGAGTGAIDWNCDSDGGTDASVSVDVNGDGMIGILTGFDDWSNLRYDFQSTSDFEDGEHDSTNEIVELDNPTHLESLGVKVNKDYRFTNVCFERDNDGDGLFSEDPSEPQVDNDVDGSFDEDPIDGVDNDGDMQVDEDPSEQVNNDGDALLNEDDIDCRGGTNQGQPLPLDSDSGKYLVEAVTKKKDGTVSSFNPGQYYAVSTITPLTELPLPTVWISERFSDCTEGASPLSNLNPKMGGGGGNVVVVAVGPDGVAKQIADSKTLGYTDLASGITVSEVLVSDDVVDRIGTLGINDVPDDAEAHVENVPADHIILVYVKFAPGLKGLTIPGEPDNMCTNENAAMTEEEGDEAVATAGLVVLEKE